MSLFIELAVQGLEALFAVAAIVACFVLFRGYAADKRPQRLFFGAAFLFSAGVFASLLTAQALNIYGGALNASPLTQLLVAQAAMVAIGVIASMSGRGRQISAVVAVAVALASVVAVTRLAAGWISIGTVHVPDLSSPGVLAAALIFAGASVLAGAPGFAALLKRSAAGTVGTQIAFSTAGFFALALALSALFLGRDLAPVAVGTCYLLISFGQFFGAAGSVSREERVIRNPLNLLRDDLVSRLSLLAAAGVWVIMLVGALGLLSAFATIQRDADLAGSRRVLDGLVQDYVRARDTALEDAVSAARPVAVQAAKRLEGNGALDLSGLVPVGRYFAVRLIDAGGRVVGSDLSSYVPGSAFPLNATTAKAAAGHNAASLEIDPALGRRVIMAAAPVTTPAGETWVLVLSTEWLGGQAGMSGPDVPVTDYGLVTANDEEILTVGKSVPPEVWQDQMIDRDGTELTDLGGNPALVRSVLTSDGEPAGSFYVLLPRGGYSGQLRQTGFVASLALAALFFIALMSAIYLSGSALRPLREIERLISGLEKGSFRPAVGRFGHDELGVLVGRLNAVAEKVDLNVSGLTSAIGQQMDFLANTAHEMRTPLNIIRWTVDMMRFGDTGRLNKDQLELLEQLNQVDQRLLTLVNNLLETSKIERGRLVLKPTACAIEDAIDQAVGFFAIKIREKQLTFNWQHLEKKLPEVSADKDRLNQILINLISNAVKYTDRGGRIDVKAAVSTEKFPGGTRGRFVKVTIQDNGRGIPAEQQRQVFSRFFRGRNVLADDIDGTGLGLYIVDKLVALHGGKIWFESVEGSGSTFAFTIPTAKRS